MIVFNTLVCLAYFALTLTLGVEGYPSGAPPTACEDMLPQHDVVAQENPSPYQALVAPLGGSRFNISLTSSTDTTFNGVFIQVRDANEQILGMFEPSDNVKAIDCIGGTMNAATHTSNDAKTSIDVVWDGTGSSGAVAVYYTTCFNSTTFWVKEMVPLP